MSQPTFNLGKDAVFSLDKPEILEELYLGASWKSKGRKDVDIDLSAVMMSANGRRLHTAAFNNANSDIANGSMYHFGDDQSGSDAKTDSDNEQIRIRLNRVPEDVKYIFAIASLYSGSMSLVSECHVSIRNSSSGPKVIDGIMNNSNKTGFVLAVIYKTNNGWEIKNLSIPHEGRTVNDFLNLCSDLVSSGLSSDSMVIEPDEIVGLSLWQRVKNAIGL